MANRFWVGGTGSTSSTSHWSATTGGSSGASVPVAGDVVAFDTNSGTGTVTDDAGLTCASITHSQAGLTVSASAAQTVTGTVTVTAGTWITGAFTHSYGFFSSTSGTRTLTLTGSTINITGTSGTPWNVSTVGTLTFTATGSTINFTGGGANVGLSINPAGQFYGAFNITGAGLWSITNGTFAAFSYTSTTNKTDSLSFQSGTSVTISAGGTLVLAGNSSVNRAFVKSPTLGTQRSISVPSGATVSITNCDVQDINMTGTFSTGATASSIGDCLGNTFGWSSVQPDPSVSPSLIGTGTINWSTAGVWSTGKVPLPQDDVSLGSSSTATTLTADMPRLGRNIDASGYLKTMTLGVGVSFFGNISLGSGMTLSGAFNVTAQGRGAQTITNNGETFSQSFVEQAFGGTYTLQDAMSISSQLVILAGTFDSQSFSLSLQACNFSSGTDVIKSSSASVWTLAANTGTIWQSNAALDTTGFLGTIKLSGPITTNVTFQGGGKNYNILNWSSTTSTGTLIITGANTFADIQTDPSTARTIQFPASTTTAVSAFSAKGSAGNLLSLTSSTPGTKATLSKASGNVVVDYLNINDSAATGGAGWYAGTHSTDNGTNTGWLFTSFLAVSGGGQMLLRGVGG